MADAKITIDKSVENLTISGARVRTTAREATTMAETVSEIANDICREVAELPDRTSPDDQPDMMLVTADELRSIIITAVSRRPLSPDVDRVAIIEECAKLCDDYARDGRSHKEYACETADEIAARIRALLAKHAGKT